MRQQSANRLFIVALGELRLGQCSEETADFLKSLSRPLNDELEPVHIYFTKLAVQFHNLDVLFRISGETFTFDCTDEGNVLGISCPADKKLLLKPNTKVMVVWNVSDTIRNGSAGAFLGVTDDGLLEVKVDVGDRETETVKLKRETWCKRERSGKVVGTRTQFPVVLFYASKCHKSQGLTLPSDVIHCSKEFVSGLMYVAVSRVRNENNIQLLRFNPDQILKLPTEAINVCHTGKEGVADLSCCRNQLLGKEHFLLKDVGEHGDEEDDPDAPESLAMDKYPNGLVSSFFENDLDNVKVDLETIFLILDENESEFSRPPDAKTIEEMLQQMIIPNPLTDFATNVNSCITSLLESQTDKFGMFVAIQWAKIFDLFGDHLVENPNEIYISRRELTKATSHLYTRVLSSADLRKEACALFEVRAISDAQLSLSNEICIKLYEKFVQNVAAAIERVHRKEAVNLSVYEMPLAGQAKIRHVGGWVVRKELEAARHYVRMNMFSTNTVTRQSVVAAHTKCELLNEFAIVPHSWLAENTRFPGTLDVTEDRQYRQRGLLHVTDDVFQFAMYLESVRIRTLNIQRLEESGTKSDIVDESMAVLLADDELKSLWGKSFDGAESDTKVSTQFSFFKQNK